MPIFNDSAIRKLKNIWALSEVIEDHFHNPEKWFGKLAVQTATNWADRISLSPYRTTSGNGVFGVDAGDEALILGSADTPITVGNKDFDIRRMQVTATSNNNPWLLRIIWGTGTMADAEAAGQFSEIAYMSSGGAQRAGPLDMQMPRLNKNTQIWIRGKNITDNATIDFLVGVHEYNLVLF